MESGQDIKGLRLKWWLQRLGALISRMGGCRVVTFGKWR